MNKACYDVQNLRNPALISNLIDFWINSPFSFIWVFQILIGYSKFLRNAYLHILLFSIGYFCRC